ncbi:hypothetical Protein YC6258_05593 [Gynuella sunshinyii YC6258]|uniref:Uncharacterized protein n=1 Tax=Gynuella sunshinyii YC6258 TaxID=1445510 RepID=A0A0C5VTV5_9GAMM|nr:hypothetical Protein YC6258_05593 [Gynuella sunshinyii YC6258]
MTVAQKTTASDQKWSNLTKIKSENFGLNRQFLINTIKKDQN